MATANACVQSQYFSGQGAFLLSDRLGTGEPKAFCPVGNVSALSIGIETTEFEHKESCTGARAIDLTIIQEVNATMTVTLESLDRENLALALFGTSADVAGSSVVDEIVAVDGLDKWYALDFIDTSSIVVTGPSGSPSYSEGTDYLCNAAAGAIFPLSTGSIPASGDLEVDYTYAAQEDIQAVTTSAGAVKYARFEGLNTASANFANLVVEIFKVQIQPLAELALISDEITQLEVEFKILSDPLQSGASKFFQIKKSVQP